MHIFIVIKYKPQYWKTRSFGFFNQVNRVVLFINYLLYIHIFLWYLNILQIVISGSEKYQYVRKHFLRGNISWRTLRSRCVKTPIQPLYIKTIELMITKSDYGKFYSNVKHFSELQKITIVCVCVLPRLLGNTATYLFSSFQIWLFFKYTFTCMYACISNSPTYFYTHG